MLYIYPHLPEFSRIRVQPQFLGSAITSVIRALTPLHSSATMVSIFCTANTAHYGGSHD